MVKDGLQNNKAQFYFIIHLAGSDPQVISTWTSMQQEYKFVQMILGQCNHIEW